MLWIPFVAVSLLLLVQRSWRMTVKQENNVWLLVVLFCTFLHIISDISLLARTSHLFDPFLSYRSWFIQKITTQVGELCSILRIRPFASRIRWGLPTRFSTVCARTLNILFTLIQFVNNQILSLVIPFID